MNFFQNKIKFFIITAFLFSAVMTVFASCGEKKLRTVDISITKADGSVVMVNSEVAETDVQRQKGFMERKNIPAGTGMIFVFDADQILYFWMKNTPTALSIAYIDSSGIIRDIFDMEPFSLASVESTVSVRYALEVPKGWFKKNGIKPGDKISLNF